MRTRLLRVIGLLLFGWCGIAAGTGIEQVQITEEDIQRAQKKMQLTPQQRQAIEQAAQPGRSLRLDALPVPLTSKSVDLGAVAKGFEAQADAVLSHVQGQQQRTGLLIFVSFSMPETTLLRIVDQAALYGGALVLRGLAKDSMRETAMRIQKLVDTKPVGFRIDPEAFQRYGVSEVPTFVITRGQEQDEAKCQSETCWSADSFVTAQGDVTIEYALEFIERSSSHFAGQARAYLAKRAR